MISGIEDGNTCGSILLKCQPSVINVINDFAKFANTKVTQLRSMDDFVLSDAEQEVVT